MSTRKRSYISNTFTGTSGGVSKTIWSAENETTISTGHPVSRLGSGGGDIGGFFYTGKTWSVYDAPHVYLGGTKYDGPIFPTPSGGGKVSVPAYSSLPRLYASGTTAIARSLPTNPYAGAATFIGEAREGVPHIMGSALLRERTRALRGSGKEYLNAEFGWKPLVADVRKFARAVKDSNKVIRQFERDSGKSVRRRFSFPASTSTTHAVKSQSCGTVFGQLGAFDQRNGRLTSTHTISKKCWFSGSFRYAIPMGNDLTSRLVRFEAEANKLLGTRLTPDVMWELAPWSWAVDWFSNTGDVIHNLSALSADGLAMQYGYVMEHNLDEVTHYWTGEINLGNGSWGSYSSVASFGGESKVRIQASPFGFGVNWDGFTPRQIAIAAAIGVTRGQ